MIRRILYTLFSFSIVFCFILMDFGVEFIYNHPFCMLPAIMITAMCLGLSFIPSNNHERNHTVGFNGMLVNIATIMMTVFPAVLVPIPALFGTGDDLSFFKETNMVAMSISAFLVVAIEAQYHLNKSEGAIKMPLHRLVIIFLIDVFGFVGLKYLCKWIGQYSGDNFFMCILLLEVLVAGPIAIVVLIFFYYIWENEKF